MMGKTTKNVNTCNVHDCRRKFFGKPILTSYIITFPFRIQALGINFLSNVFAIKIIVIKTVK